ncbi:hypothetical protein [Streptomyces vilmorinianum]|uniref:hypothetical protein n=1 Tax=Streptomyces vilmorinianum TaxID=3051092 RepID=UPI0010FB4AB6|nr:hypothetical protein [Streptomyces vilmorinianum]
MSHQDNSVFVDASGRRGRVMRWAAAGVGVACLGFLAVVVAGTFGAGPANGPLPWVDAERPAAPTLIQTDPSGGAGGDSDDASATPSKPTASPSASTTAPRPSDTTKAPDSSAPTTAAPTATSGTDTAPGKAGNAPGATKRPK